MELEKSFIAQYADEVLEDLDCMTNAEIEDAIDKIESYAVSTENETLAGWLTKVLNKLNLTVANKNRKVNSYFSGHFHDSYWGKETKI